jgi:hypothetical protein
MNLIGDPIGLEELKKMKEERKSFLKFLITEAKTSFARAAHFKGSTGQYWKLVYHGERNELEITPSEKPQEAD